MGPHRSIIAAAGITHEGADFQNVAEFEEIIGEVSDCVVLFPESPGSFAELGYFARNEKLRTKLLVVNDADLQGQDSFIALGPIDTIDKHSLFRKTIQIRYEENPDFRLVKERLESRIFGKRRRKFKFVNFSLLSIRERFFAIFEMIKIFQSLTFESVAYTFRSIFGHVNPTELKRLLSILVAAGMVERRGDDLDFFCINRGAQSFMDFESLDLSALQLEILDFYEEHAPEVAAVVRELSE